MNIQQYFEEKEQMENEKSEQQGKAAGSTGQPPTHPTASTVIPVVEEQATISKQVVTSASVVVHTHVSEGKQSLAIPLTTETYEVKRVAMNEFVDERPPVREEGNCIIVPVVEEVLVVQKRLKLVEEVHLVKRQVTETHKEDIVLKKEEVTVERVSAAVNNKV